MKYLDKVVGTGIVLQKELIHAHQQLRAVFNHETQRETDSHSKTDDGQFQRYNRSRLRRSPILGGETTTGMCPRPGRRDQPIVRIIDVNRRDYTVHRARRPHGPFSRAINSHR